jgi:hypothetical protein
MDDNFRNFVISGLMVSVIPPIVLVAGGIISIALLRFGGVIGMVLTAIVAIIASLLALSVFWYGVYGVIKYPIVGAIREAGRKK